MTTTTNVKEFNLGIIDGDGLRYLGDNLSKFTTLHYLTIEESNKIENSNSKGQKSRWTLDDQEHFINRLEQARLCPLLSINVLSLMLNDLEKFIGSLGLIFESRREIYLLSEEEKQQSSVLELETKEVENLYRHFKTFNLQENV